MLMALVQQILMRDERSPISQVNHGFKFLHTAMAAYQQLSYMIQQSALSTKHVKFAACSLTSALIGRKGSASQRQRHWRVYLRPKGASINAVKGVYFFIFPLSEILHVLHHKSIRFYASLHNPLSSRVIILISRRVVGLWGEWREDYVLARLPGHRRELPLA